MILLNLKPHTFFDTRLSGRCAIALGRNEVYDDDNEGSNGSTADETDRSSDRWREREQNRARAPSSSIICPLAGCYLVLSFEQWPPIMSKRKIHYPPLIAFQLFKRLEVLRHRQRLEALYRRQQAKMVLLAEK